MELIQQGVGVPQDPAGHLMNLPRCPEPHRAYLCVLKWRSNTVQHDRPAVVADGIATLRDAQRFLQDVFKWPAGESCRFLAVSFTDVHCHECHVLCGGRSYCYHCLRFLLRMVPCMWKPMMKPCQLKESVRPLLFRISGMRS